MLVTEQGGQMLTLHAPTQKPYRTATCSCVAHAAVLYWGPRPNYSRPFSVHFHADERCAGKDLPRQQSSLYTLTYGDNAPELLSRSLIMLCEDRRRVSVEEEHSAHPPAASPMFNPSRCLYSIHFTMPPISRPGDTYWNSKG